MDFPNLDVFEMPASNDLAYSVVDLELLGLNGGEVFLRGPISLSLIQRRLEFYDEIASTRAHMLEKAQQGHGRHYLNDEPMERIVSRMPERKDQRPEVTCGFFFGGYDDHKKNRDSYDGIMGVLSTYEATSKLGKELKSRLTAVSTFFAWKKINSIRDSAKRRYHGSDAAYCYANSPDLFRPFVEYLTPFYDLKEQLSYFYRNVSVRGSMPHFLEGNPRGTLVDVYPTSVQPIPNTISWTDECPVTLITGENDAGKSVYVQSIGVSLVRIMNGIQPIATDVQLRPVRRVWPLLPGRPKEGHGSYVTHSSVLALISQHVTQEDIVLLDEPYSGTTHTAQSNQTEDLLEILRERKIITFVNMHDIALAKKLAAKPGYRALYVDPEHKVHEGVASDDYGVVVSKRHAFDPQSVQAAIDARDIRMKFYS